jgi:hypothetical protein
VLARKAFVLTKRILVILRRKGLLRRCKGCGREFEVGEVVVSVPCISNHKRKWYCLRCARRYGVWISR